MLVERIIHHLYRAHIFSQNLQLLEMDQFDRFSPDLPDRSWQPIKLSYSCCGGFSLTGLWLFEQTEAPARGGNTLKITMEIVNNTLLFPVLTGLR